MNESTHPAARRFVRGDKVTPDPEYPGLPATTFGRVFTVDKVNPRNLRCNADDGGKGINFPAAALLPASDENVKKAFAPRPFQPVAFFAAGEVVTLKRAWRDITAETPLVVMKDGGGDKVNLVRLGGDGGRYLRMPREGIVKRDMAWLAEALLAEV